MSATGHALPLLVTVLLWFASTALIVWLDQGSRRGVPLSLTVSGLLALGAVGVIAATADDKGIAAAYASFIAALCIWGWHEMSFLTGLVTGPRREPCPLQAHGWQRFRLAAATLIHHEIALALTALLLVVLSWGEPNQTGAATFGLLLAMRLSTKLNIFLGVPNFDHELLPARLGYLKGYFRRRAFNPLLPVSLALATGLAAWLATEALAAEGGAAVRAALLFALAALGVIEHLFLIVPWRDAALWRWASPARQANR